MSVGPSLRRSVRAAFLLAITGFAACPALAQWSASPAQSVGVAVGAGDQNVPVIRAIPGGGVWVFYFDNSAGTGYKPVIQRLDACGYPVFPGGIVLANRTNTATFVSDMKVDAAGNAYAAFDNGSVIAQKIAPDGTLPWGAAGVAVPGSTGVLGPRIAGLDDGSAVVAFNTSATVNFQRLNADGTLPAGGTWTVTEASRYQAISDLLPGGSGEVIALWVRGSILSAITSAKGLRIQKFNAANAPQWNTGVGYIDVFTSSTTAGSNRSIQNGYFPALVNDAAAGAIVAWYNTGFARDARVQHVLADGTVRFPAEGLAATTTPATAELRLSAAVAYTAPGSYTVFYQKSNPSQSQFGLGVSRVELDPALATTQLTFAAGAGIDVLNISATTFQSSFIDAKPLGADALATWIQSQGASGPTIIQAARVRPDGTFAWATPVATIASTPSSKGRLGVAPLSAPGAFVAAWNDGASGAADILAQRFTDAGVVGPAFCPADFDCSGVRDVSDIFAFLSAWFSSARGSDFDASSTRDVSDIFAFLSSWFAGCP